MTTVAIGRNRWSLGVPETLERAARELGVEVRVFDLTSTRFDVTSMTVADQAGPIAATHLAPCLTYFAESGAVGIQVLEDLGVKALNPMASVALADSKAETARVLAERGVSQVDTVVCPLALDVVREVAQRFGDAVVLKRTQGAQGRWVRPARNPEELANAFEELAAEGPGAVVVQPLIEEAMGQSLRVIVTAGKAVAATLRQATGSEWRSNVAQGGTQALAELSEAEAALAVRAVAALGLGHAGVDLLRTDSGPTVLEVNACPDYTSMTPYVSVDIAKIVIEAVLAVR